MYKGIPYLFLAGGGEGGCFKKDGPTFVYSEGRGLSPE